MQRRCVRCSMPFRHLVIWFWRRERWLSSMRRASYTAVICASSTSRSPRSEQRSGAKEATSSTSIGFDYTADVSGGGIRYKHPRRVSFDMRRRAREFILRPKHDIAALQGKICAVSPEECWTVRVVDELWDVWMRWAKDGRHADSRWSPCSSHVRRAGDGGSRCFLRILLFSLVAEVIIEFVDCGKRIIISSYILYIDIIEFYIDAILRIRKICNISNNK